MAVLLKPFPPGPNLRVHLLDAGWSKHHLKAAINRGDIRYVLPGVLLRSDVALTIGVKARAVSLVLVEGTALARRTAAWLYDVDVMPPGAHLQLPPVDTLVAAGRSPSRRDDIVGRSATVPPEDLVVIGGITVTSPLRTALDLGRLSRRPEALVALDALTHAGLVTVEELRESAHGEALVHQRGVRQLRQLVEWTEPLTESPGESRSRLHLLDAGFPRPRAQLKVFDYAGQFVARLDLAYEAAKVAVEFDGVKDHTRDEDVRHDRGRRSDAEQLGWRFTVARKGDVYGDGRALVEAVGELLQIEPRRVRPPWAA
jgi:very-short-patch-repair endonuclease